MNQAVILHGVDKYRLYESSLVIEQEIRHMV